MPEYLVTYQKSYEKLICKEIVYVPCIDDVEKEFKRLHPKWILRSYGRGGVGTTDKDLLKKRIKAIEQGRMPD